MRWGIVQFMDMGLWYIKMYKKVKVWQEKKLSYLTIIKDTVIYLYFEQYEISNFDAKVMGIWYNQKDKKQVRKKTIKW